MSDKREDPPRTGTTRSRISPDLERPAPARTTRWRKEIEEGHPPGEDV